MRPHRAFHLPAVDFPPLFSQRCPHPNPPPAIAMNRRHFLRAAAAAAASGLVLAPTFPAFAAETSKRRFTVDLCPGNIGVSGGLPDLIRLAKTHGFESLQPDAGYFVGKEPAAVQAGVAALREAGLKWGAAGLGAEFRQSEEVFQRDLAGLPKVAAALQAAGATRMGTWLRPGHQDLAYADNFKLHVRRLREISKVLREHGLRFGLEYVGTPSLAARHAQPFVRTLPQARELIAAIDVPGTGLVLDSWHWWTAGDSVEALRQLRNEDVVAVDLNDAPAGVALKDQQDNQRELPVATGVIPVKAFVEALLAIQYDGPVRAEPFNRPLNQLENDAACAQTATAIKKAFALAGV